METRFSTGHDLPASVIAPWITSVSGPALSTIWKSFSRAFASAVWKNDRTFEMTWRYYETPHHDTLTCLFDEDKLIVSFLSSIAAMAGKPKDSRSALIGRLQA